MAYRAITLCLLTSNTQLLDLPAELNRLFKYSLDTATLDTTQLCHDILLLKEVN